MNLYIYLHPMSNLRTRGSITPLTTRLRGVVIKHMNNFTFLHTQPCIRCRKWRTTALQTATIDFYFKDWVVCVHNSHPLPLLACLCVRSENGRGVGGDPEFWRRYLQPSEYGRRSRVTNRRPSENGYMWQHKLFRTPWYIRVISHWECSMQASLNLQHLL